MTSKEIVADWLDDFARRWESSESFESCENARCAHQSVQDVYEIIGENCGALSRLSIAIGKTLSAWKRGEHPGRGPEDLRSIAVELRTKKERVVDVPEEFLF